MKYFSKFTALTFSLLAVSAVAVAGGDPDEFPGPEGVLLDLDEINLSTGDEPVVTRDTPVTDKTTATVKAEPDAATVVTGDGKPVSVGESALTTKSVPVAVAKVEVAASENSTNPVIRTIVDAMRPSDQTPPLDNDRFSLYLSDEVLFAQFERSGKRYGLDRSRVHLGFLHSEERDSVFQTGLSIDASFTKSFRLSFGTRAYVALLNLENMDAFAAALGAETAYKLPFKALPLEFGASFYYAPDVLTFGAGDRTLDAQVDVTLPVRSQFSVFGGFRFLQVDTRPDDREIDNRVHLGVRWDFM